MIVECEKCQKKYKIDEEKTDSLGSGFVCSKCRNETGFPASVVVKKPESASRKKKIIIADDTAFFRAMLKDLLTESGYEVITAANGEEALLKVKHELPDLDLLLLDMLMPKMDGFQVIEEIKKGAMGRNLPILALSGVFKSDEDKALMKKLGVVGYVDKNTPPEQILNRVHLILTP